MWFCLSHWGDESENFVSLNAEIKTVKRNDASEMLYHAAGF